MTVPFALLAWAGLSLAFFAGLILGHTMGYARAQRYFRAVADYAWGEAKVEPLVPPSAEVQAAEEGR